MSAQEKTLNSLVEFEVTISRNGVVKNIEKSYVYCPRVNFLGRTVEWFEDAQHGKKDDVV